MQAQPRPRPARPPLRPRNQTGRRPVQDPQARPDRQADPAHRDQVLADAGTTLTKCHWGMSPLNRDVCVAYALTRINRLNIDPKPIASGLGYAQSRES